MFMVCMLEPDISSLFKVRTQLYAPDCEENTEKEQSKLQLRLKRNRTELVGQLAGSLSEDTVPSQDTHDSVMKLLSGVKDDILESDDTDSDLHLDIMLNLTYDDIINTRDAIFDEIERNQKQEETNLS